MLVVILLEDIMLVNNILLDIASEQFMLEDIRVVGIKLVDIILEDLILVDIML